MNDATTEENQCVVFLPIFLSIDLFFFMKPLLPILSWLWSSLAIAQAKEVSSFSKWDTVKTTYAKASAVKPEILTSGFIDIINNGQVNASARFIRLFIGEPGKFAFRKKNFKMSFLP